MAANSEVDDRLDLIQGGSVYIHSVAVAALYSLVGLWRHSLSKRWMDRDVVFIVVFNYAYAGFAIL